MKKKFEMCCRRQLAEVFFLLLFVSRTLTQDAATFANYKLHIPQKMHLMHDNASEYATKSMVDFAIFLAAQYPEHCLRIGVGISWNSEPHVMVSDDPAGWDILKVLKDSTIGVSRINCIMFLFAKPPSKQLIKSLYPHGLPKRFLLIVCTSAIELKATLLDTNLRDDEHVVGIVAENSSLAAYNRRLYTNEGVPKIARVVQWRAESGAAVDRELFPEQMKNFYGTKFKVTTLDFRPYTDYQSFPGTRIVQEKPCLDVYILREIARKLNFTYDIVMPADDLWGTRLPNGTWTGVVGDVQFRRTNLSLVLSLTVERILVVDFTKMYYVDPMTYVTARNMPKAHWQKVFEPFTGLVWVITNVVILICAIIYHVLRRGKLRGRRVSIIQTFLHLFGNFFSQPLENIPVRLTAQVFMFFWIVYSFLVTSYYKSALMAVLAVPAPPPLLNTLEELLHSDYHYGMIDAKGSEYQLFSTSDVYIYKTLFSKMTFYSSAESFKRVAQGHYAYIYFQSNIESIVSTQYTDQHGQTNLHIASEKFFPGGYAWAFPKGVPYRRTFDQVMWRCVQSGLVNKWVQDLNILYRLERQHLIKEGALQEEAPPPPVFSPNDLIILNMRHLQGVFIALIIGHGLGVLSFVLELLLRHRKDFNCFPQQN